MNKISLTQGKHALVDDKDFERLSQFKWHLRHNGYAARNKSRKVGGGTIFMHRIVLGAPKGMESDHINGDKLDNRRKNLRICTSSQNKANRNKQSNNSSGFKGVRFNVERGKWCAFIGFKGRSFNLGRFKYRKEAIVAYNKAAKKHFGEFALLNNI